MGNRDRIVAALRDSPGRNAVVLTGDVHAHWAAEVKERFDDPTSPTVATGLVATSITSGGDGSETEEDTAGILADNPHIRFYNNRRGYVRTRFTDGQMRADFQVVPTFPGLVHRCRLGPHSWFPTVSPAYRPPEMSFIASFLACSRHGCLGLASPI